MLIALKTTLYRIVFEAQVDDVLKGAVHPEGRFHHTGQTALYASPSPETAAIAIKIYLRPDDAPRVMVPLALQSVRMVDLRDPKTCDALGIDSHWPSVPWADERASGVPATSWKASDAARAAGADGMIYASRRAPAHWHVVLFSWNQDACAMLSVAGHPTCWTPAP